MQQLRMPPHERQWSTTLLPLSRSRTPPSRSQHIHSCTLEDRVAARISLLGRGCGALGAERGNKTSERVVSPFCPLLDPPRFRTSLLRCESDHDESPSLFSARRVAPPAPANLPCPASPPCTRRSCSPGPSPVSSVTSLHVIQSKSSLCHAVLAAFINRVLSMCPCWCSPNGGDRSHHRRGGGHGGHNPAPRVFHSTEA
jgi:hypothetical protein